MTLFPSQSHITKLVLLSLLATIAALPFYPAPPAQAGLLDAFGGRGSGNASGRRSGGAVRDECPVNGADVGAFQALVPGINKMFTSSSHPAFWFHVPFTRSEELRYAEFMLLDAEDKTYVLEQPLVFDLPAEPGIVQVNLPESFPGLVSDRPYLWYFSIQCDPNELSRNPVLSGEIERLSQGDRSPLWPETMMEVLDNRPADDWQAFLEVIQLGHLTHAPIAELRMTTD